MGGGEEKSIKTAYLDLSQARHENEVQDQRQLLKSRRGEGGNVRSQGQGGFFALCVCVSVHCLDFEVGPLEGGGWGGDGGLTTGGGG